MIKMMAAARRRPGMTHQEFLAYIEEVHGNLAWEKPLGIVRYLQNHLFDGAYGSDADPGYQQTFHRDSVTELFFETFEDLGRTFSDPYVQQKVGPDGPNFADMASTMSLLAHDVEFDVPQPGNGAIKVLHFIRRKEDLPLEEFFARWTRCHEKVLAANRAISRRLRRYVQSRSLPEGAKLLAYFGGEGVVCEGVANFWFESEDDLRLFRAYQRTIEAASIGEDAFIEPQRSFCVYAKEVTIYQLPSRPTEAKGS